MEDENEAIARTGLEVATDAVTDLLTGITVPAPIRKNVFKAFDRLCSAAIDIPVSYLEGKAAERRAETQARVKLIAASGDQIAKDLKPDSEYANRAAQKYGERILREQINVDQACEVAAEHLKHELLDSGVTSEKTSDAKEISDEWLSSFEREASAKTSEEMQLLFGRILAGEIKTPESFSIKTIKLLGSLDSNIAAQFQKLCSISVSLEPHDKIFDARAVSVAGNAANNGLIDFGLGFDQLNLLQEYGLIIGDYNSSLDYKICIANADQKVGMYFMYQGKAFGLVSSGEPNFPDQLAFHGVALSRSGKELFRIVDKIPNDVYTARFKEFLGSRGFEMVDVRIA